MKVFITGANGFLGSNLAKYMDKNTDWDISCMVNNNSDKVPSTCRIIKHNLNHDIHLTEYFDVVIHIAACPSSKTCLQKPAEGLNNIIQTFNVLEFCRQNKVPNVIFFSSCEVYGDGHDSIKEDYPVRPLNMYAASKLSGESMCCAYHESYNLNFVIMRVINVWGDDCQSDRFCSIIKERFKNDSFPEFTVKTVDKKRWLHVDDMCKKIHLLLKKEFPKYEIFNLVGDEDITPEEFISKFGDKFKIQYNLEKTDGYCNNFNANGSKLSAYLQ
jgi:nucleoside-diphosphate-sugar epimerase